MQLMLNVCEKFAVVNNLKFSTDPNPSKSKSKCIFVRGKDKRAVKPKPLKLDDKDLPWVESANHLGHILHESGSMEQDIKEKRAKFIDESTRIRESFAFASPNEILHAVKVYAGSHYGSNLWKLDNVLAKQYFTVWQTCVKLAWQVPRKTHTYFVDHLLSCGMTYVRIDVISRYAKFLAGLVKSSSLEVE